MRLKCSNPTLTSNSFLKARNNFLLKILPCNNGNVCCIIEFTYSRQQRLKHEETCAFVRHFCTTRYFIIAHNRVRTYIYHTSFPAVQFPAQSIRDYLDVSIGMKRSRACSKRPMAAVIFRTRPCRILIHFSLPSR